MRFSMLALGAAAMIAASPAVFAQGSATKAPGQQMQENGSVKGSPGASGYAPGQQMQDRGSKPGTNGASGYAPGHSTSGSAAKSDRDKNDSKSSKYK